MSRQVFLPKEGTFVKQHSPSKARENFPRLGRRSGQSKCTSMCMRAAVFYISRLLGFSFLFFSMVWGSIETVFWVNVAEFFFLRFRKFLTCHNLFWNVPAILAFDSPCGSSVQYPMRPKSGKGCSELWEVWNIKHWRAESFCVGVHELPSWSFGLQQTLQLLYR